MDSFAIHYHERTKYNPETITQRSKRINFANQPSPFKDYKVGQRYDLKPYLKGSAPDRADPDGAVWWRLSQLLFRSYGITAKMVTLVGPPLYLRSAPSAGGLYPAEVYLLSKGTPQLPAGLYNYQSSDHSLIRFWDQQVWPELQRVCFEHPVLAVTDYAIVTSAIFYRSAWRYEDRAYRRIFLDTGHLLGNLELAGALTGFRPYLITGFQDQAINELMYFDGALEGVLTVVPLVDERDRPSPVASPFVALPSPIHDSYAPVDDGELLYYLHRATIIHTQADPDPEVVTNPDDKYNFPFCLKISMATEPIDFGPNLQSLAQAMAKRRSTRTYTGADLSLEELRSLLHFTYQPQDYQSQGLDPSPDYCDRNLLETFVVVSGVDGLDAGCYYYAPKAQELRQIRFKNFRRELHFLCLGQDLGRDAGAVVFHTVDLKRAVQKYGDRAYRYLHLDAGHLGQRLNLAAIALDLGVSGIGGFFDDQVNDVLGIPPEEAVVYITTLGRPRSRDQ
ncbi:SagB/ThcOx family dehydrogenase [Spirulina major]|uniref:SagB/ThcOx family dehydrogenase n=1 Tax=Spirulina major TaxID=270636 RepID=UPI00093318BC|nr:SagB/ThcOx family dehydrogenase [Spirulina major]